MEIHFYIFNFSCFFFVFFGQIKSTLYIHTDEVRSRVFNRTTTYTYTQRIYDNKFDKTHFSISIFLLLLKNQNIFALENLIRRITNIVNAKGIDTRAFSTAHRNNIDLICDLLTVNCSFCLCTCIYDCAVIIHNIITSFRVLYNIQNIDVYIYLYIGKQSNKIQSMHYESECVSEQ